jgi:predicted DCC family thiol-disulfide oxidoreductase YuxK
VQEEPEGVSDGATPAPPDRAAFRREGGVACGEGSARRADRPIVLYDGWCNLCDSSVAFLLRRDRRARLRFAALQSPAGKALLGRCESNERLEETLVLVYQGRCRTRSDAVLTLLGFLPWPWPLLGWLRLIPRRLRDRVYATVARRRLAWFGRAETCRTSLAGYPERFIE